MSLAWFVLFAICATAYGQDAAAALRGRTCKVTSGAPGWPTAAQFKAELPNVIFPVPPESACYQTNMAGTGKSCDEVKANAYSGQWRASLPGGTHLFNWQAQYYSSNNSIESCYYDTSLNLPCQIGAVPPVGVDARNVFDVVAAVKFAAKYNLKLVVKNTGHDYLGRSMGKGAFMLWTHNIKGINYNSNGATLSLGAGVQWNEAYNAAAREGRFIAGGISTDGSVGAAGGWILGGGHNPLSGKYGLGVDNVVEFEMVDAKGNIVKVDAKTNAPLWYALRGGGGGTFGVVTKVTYKTYPNVPQVGFFWSASISDKATRKKFLASLIKYQQQWSDLKFGGLVIVNDPVIIGAYLAPDLPFAQVTAATSAWLTEVRAYIPEFGALYPEYPDYKTWYDSFVPANFGPAGGNTLLVSRLWSKSNLANNQNAMADFLVANPGTQFHTNAGGVVAQGDKNAMALNPAWRDAIGLVIHKESYAEGISGAQYKAINDKMLSVGQQMDKIVGTGTYFNEAFRGETNPIPLYFGDNKRYLALSAIKLLWDPNSLFLVHHGVGSEQWDATLTCPK